MYVYLQSKCILFYLIVIGGFNKKFLRIKKNSSKIISQFALDLSAEIQSPLLFRLKIKFQASSGRYDKLCQ